MLKLKQFSYSEFLGTPKEWRLENIEFLPLNLIVGRNASGKSRILSVITSCARLLSGKMPFLFEDAHFRVTLESANDILEYELNIQKHIVVLEHLLVDGVVKLNRDLKGAQLAFLQENKSLDLRPISSEIIAFTKKDPIQHPFLMELYEWAVATRFLGFGTDLGKNLFVVNNATSSSETSQLNELLNNENTVETFKSGRAQFRDAFYNDVLRDMNAVGYPCDAINIETIGTANTGMPLEHMAVKEHDLPGTTQQLQMSMGMYRALSSIIHFNFGIYSKKISTILLDDIGEGLDFERATQLVKLLIEKSKRADFQLIMTSNDRFIMNAVQIDYWSIVQRNKGLVRIINNRNSPKSFEDFKELGLNNFDFFSKELFKEE